MLFLLAALLGSASANLAPTTLEAYDIGFKINVLKSTDGLTHCDKKNGDAYTVVSLLRTDKERARILNPYIVKLLMQCHVQEVHTWDLYEKEDGSGHLAGELSNFDDTVPEMLKLYGDWRQRRIRTEWAGFYDKYAVPDRKNAVLVKLEDDILYMDVGGLAKATEYAADNPKNFLTIPNMVSGKTAYSHEKCLQEKTTDDMTSDQKAADTHWHFLKNPACFSKDSLIESVDEKSCVAIDPLAVELGNVPLAAYVVHWQKIKELSNLLKDSKGDSNALIDRNVVDESCIHSGATMASISPSEKRSSGMFLPLYKLLAQQIKAGGRITDDGLSEEILKVSGFEKRIPADQRILLQKDADAQRASDRVSCPRIRSHVDLAQCTVPTQKRRMQWLQLEQTVPDECRRPCTAPPEEFQGAHFVSEAKQLALFSSPKLTKPLGHMIDKNALDIQVANPETPYESKQYNKIVVTAKEPLDTFAHSVSMLFKAMKQIGVDKKTLKQTIVQCKASLDSGCQELLTHKLPVLEKYLDLESFDSAGEHVDAHLIKAVLKDIKRLVYPGCEAQLGHGTAPEMVAFLPSYLQIETKKPYHVIREEYAEADLSQLWEKLGMQVESKLADFGLAEDKTYGEIKSGAEDLEKDIKEAVSLLQEKQEGHETQSRDATIKAMQQIAKDAEESAKASANTEFIKGLITEDEELTKSFCSIYSMDYSCLGYHEEFEKICGNVEGPDKVEMKKDFILKISAPKTTLRRKTTEMRLMSSYSCLAAADSQISLVPFVNDEENCKAHCESKWKCKSFNFDQATFGCRLYNDAPTGVQANLHSTCGSMCKDNDAGLKNAMIAKGLHSIGANCDSASDYCNQEDVMLHCPVTCKQCNNNIV